MDRPKLKLRLAIEEGYRNKAYLDNAPPPGPYLSIGIGHNCHARPVYGVSKVGDYISDALIDILFNRDIDEAIALLDHFIPWWRQLDDARENVMIDLCFNMGITTLLTFKNTLAAIKAGNWREAYNGLDNSLWDKQVKSRADWLENVMLTGVYA